MNRRVSVRFVLVSALAGLVGCEGEEPQPEGGCLELCLERASEAACRAECDAQVNYLWEIHMHNLILHEDEEVYAEISDCVLRIGEVLQSHGVKASWGVMEKFAEAAMLHDATEDHVFSALEAMGHEIGMHSIGYTEDPTEVLTSHFGYSPRYSCPGFSSAPEFEGQLAIIEDMAIDQGYTIVTDHLAWLGDASHDDLDLIYAWPPSLDPEIGDFTVEDPSSGLMMVNQQGGGWVGARDVDVIESRHFEMLEVNSPLEHFVEHAVGDSPVVYPVTLHEDLFTTGPLIQQALEELLASGGEANWNQLCLADDCDLKDEQCSDEALATLDTYLTEVVDPRIASGELVSRTFGEIFDEYFAP